MSDHHLDGLDGEVVVTRDRWGIPCVRAGSIADLFLGQGFATAVDRLGQMEWDRRRGLGRTAEVHGTAANVVTDAHHRRLRLADHARAGYAALDDETRSVLDAYVAGVNAAAATHPPPDELATLGVPVEPWAPWTPILVFLVRHISFGTWQSKLWNVRVLAALGPDAVGRFGHEGRAGETPVIVPSGVRVALADLGEVVGRGDVAGLATTLPEALAPLGLSLSGSNAWGVHGRRTATGAPIVAGDPHRALELPNVYSQLHLDGPGIDASGISFVGVPGIQHFAQTDRVAWAVTNAMADYQDLYVERLPDAITDRRVETVVVRDGDDVEVECLTTRHGPVVVGASEHGVGVALAASGLVEPGGTLRTILPMLRAASVADLAAALSDWVEPVNNLVLADTDGHLGYRTAGRVPRRPAVNHHLPVPGDDPAYDWTGWIGPDELPAADDPEVGLVVTANQRITDAPIADELGADYAAPHRALRIWARLDQRTDLDVEDQRTIHTDDVWRIGQALATRIVALGGPAADALAGWDGRMAADSTAASLVARTYGHLVRAIAATLPVLLRDNPFAAWEPPATALPAVLPVGWELGALVVGGDRTGDEVIPGVRWPDHLPAAVAAALAEGESAWGDVHRLTPRFALRGADAGLDERTTVTSPPLGGGSNCVFATNQVDGLTMAAVTGSTARYVWDLADRRRSRWIVPLGASGDPASPHVTDQLPLWSAGELIPVLDDEITSTTTLHPNA